MSDDVAGPSDTRAGVAGAETPASAPTVFLHIGTMKSGTSYLQQILSRNGRLLEKRGVLAVNSTQPVVKATMDALDREQDHDEFAGAWHAVASEMSSWPGRAAVLSGEILSFASSSAAQSVVESLRPARVVIIITARDLARQLPSAWQNKIKHGRGWLFSSYVASARDEPPAPNTPGRSFWHHHDLATITARWADAAGASNVVLIPVPPSGAPPDLLWRHFAEVLDVPAEDFDTTQDQGSNFSLGYLETELIRKVNREVRETLDREEQRAFVLQYVANEILRPHPGDEPRVRTVLDPESYDWAVERSERMVFAIRALGVRVVGDLDDLIPPPLSEEERAAAAYASEHRPTVPDEIARAVSALVIRIAELEGHGTAPVEGDEGPLERRRRLRKIRRTRQRDERRSARPPPDPGEAEPSDDEPGDGDERADRGF